MQVSPFIDIQYVIEPFFGGFGGSIESVKFVLSFCELQKLF